MGLATYTHDRDTLPATRSFLFRDELVQSFAVERGQGVEHDQGEFLLHLLLVRSTNPNFTYRPAEQLHVI